MKSLKIFLKYINMYLIHLNILANIIINTYLNESLCAYVFSQNTGINYQGILPVVNIKISNTNEFNVEHLLEYGCQDIIIQVNEPAQVIENLEQKIKLQTQRFNERRYLIFPTEYTSNNDLENLPSHSDLHFVPNLLIIVPEIDNNSTYFEENYVFKLITNKFIGTTNNDDTVLLDVWYSQNETFEWNNNLFPDKLSNLHGREFRMATFNYKPYAIATDNDIDGTEMRIALEFAAKHNATVKLVVDDEHEWGEIYDNWTGNGILGNVVMDYAEVGFGALYTWYHEYGFLDLSLPVVRTGITCLAPAPLLQSGLLVPFFPFDLVLWIAVMVSFVVSLISYICIYYLNYFQRKRENDPDLGDVEDRFVMFLMMVRIFLLQSWPTIRALDKPAIRCVLTCILVFSLLLATCYNSGLASSMTVPRYEKAIQTVHDLADSNLNWGATHEAWVFSILSATEPILVKIVNNFKTQTEQQLQKRTTKRNYAFSIERLPFGHYAIGAYITSEAVPHLLLMKEDIYWEQCVLMTRKNSHFLPDLNNLILRIHETGLPYIWETLVALHYLDNQVQLAVRLLASGHHSEDEPIKLKVNHIQGMLVIWAGGLIIAAISFIVEIVVYKCTYNINSIK